MTELKDIYNHIDRYYHVSDHNPRAEEQIRKMIEPDLDFSKQLNICTIPGNLNLDEHSVYIYRNSQTVAILWKTIYNITGYSTKPLKNSIFYNKYLSGVLYFGYNRKSRLRSTPIRYAYIDLSKNDSIPERMFEDCKSLKEVVFTNKIELPPNCFSNCQKLSKLVLLSGCRAVNENTFAHCTDLKTVNLGAVEIIKECSFSYSSLKYIKLNSDVYYVTDFGIIEVDEKNSSCKVLYVFPTTTKLEDRCTVYTKNGVKTFKISKICDEAAMKTDLKWINLSYTYETGERSFANNTQLMQVSMGTSVTSLIIDPVHLMAVNL